MLRTFFFENRFVYEIRWKNIVEPGRPQKTIRRMRIACWIIRIQAHTQNIQHITFSIQQWLHERASMLRYTYIACRFVYMVCSPLLVSHVYLEHSWYCFVLMTFVQLLEYVHIM